MPPADPTPACACGSPFASWDADGVRVCATCAANIATARGLFVVPAAVPPPEWAVNEAYAYFNLPLAMSVKPKCAEDIRKLARLLVSVRERTLREAARLCWSEARAWDKIPGTDNGAREVVCDDLSDAILSLIAQPPKEAK
jgi:hypothetical protein